jgi:hypothetical protein
MYKLLLLICITGILMSCGETPKKQAVVKGKTLVMLPVSPEKVKGVYKGNFKGSPISIVLNYVSNRHASGYNVHKGLMRNLAGTIRFDNDKLHLELAEPGNNPSDGLFVLQLDTASWKGQGNWKPLKKGQPTSFSFGKDQKPAFEDGYGLTFVDSLSNSIMLRHDGSAVYSYLSDTTDTGQQLTIRGNYQRTKNTITIYWQKNAVFPSGKSVFKLFSEKPYPDEDFIQQSLKGDDGVFSELIL